MGFHIEINFNFDDSWRVTVSVKEYGIKDDDKDKKEIELNFRKPFVAEAA